MPKPKYKIYFQKMIDENRLIFEKFKRLQEKYSLNPEELQEEFNKQGEKILEIVSEYESRLCANTERGGIFNKFSASLAEKFKDEVRKHFPYIDYIGLIAKADKKSTTKPTEFTLKKISL